MQFIKSNDSVLWFSVTATGGVKEPFTSTLSQGFNPAVTFSAVSVGLVSAHQQFVDVRKCVWKQRDYNYTTQYCSKYLRKNQSSNITKNVLIKIHKLWLHLFCFFFCIIPRFLRNSWQSFINSSELSWYVFSNRHKCEKTLRPTSHCGCVEPREPQTQHF